MSYPQHPPPSSPYNYGAPPPQSSQPSNYGAPPPQSSQPSNYGAPPQPQTAQPFNYGAPPPQSSQPSDYGAPPQPQTAQPHNYGAPPPQSYGAPSAPYAPPHGASQHGEKPQKTKPYDSAVGGASAAVHAYGSSYPPSAPYGSPFASLVPSVFPPGTDPNVVACFQMADQDGSGFIDDMELQGVLSSYNQKFSMRTVHLLMYHFTNTNTRKIGPKEFIAVFYSLQNWRSIFERFDRDRSGKIDTAELRDALLSLGFAVSPVILELLVSKYDKSGGRNKAIEYDNFIECCLTVKGLTEKFKERDTNYSGSATFTYESFMLTVLPFLVA